MLELFVFNSVMRSGLFKPSDLVVAPLKSADGDMLGQLKRLADTFNVHDSQCYRDVDRETIFGIVETAGDGHKGFDSAVRSLAGDAWRRSMEKWPLYGKDQAADGMRQRTTPKGTNELPSVPPSPPASEGGVEREGDVEEGLERTDA